jgi:hypothetical protein
VTDRAPYSRVYWSIFDDPKFDSIRSDVKHFGSWSMMLLVADMAYPAPAFVPPTIPRRSLEALVQSGLVDVLPGHLYRVHGLDAERTRRSASASRLPPKRDPTGTQEGPGCLPSQVIAESVDEAVDEAQAPREDPPEDDAADTYWSLTGKYPAGKALSWIDDLIGQYGSEATTRSLAQAHISDPSTSTLLGRTTDLLRAEARALGRKEREDEQRRLREKRAIPRELPPWEQEFRDAIARQYASRDAA